jgi:N-acetylmuramoyl-L-alanine amidase
MDPAALVSLCLLLSRGTAPRALPPGVSCPAAATAPRTIRWVLDGQDLAARLAGSGARVAIGRVALAEAGNQGDSGLAGVIYTILNRLTDGRWGSSVDAVVDAPGQFEPVSRVGGDWRRLPALSAADQARVDTILNLAVEGRLPDLTGGARYFQNPVIVAARARVGAVRPALVNFGGQSPSAIIGAHSFFTGEGRGGGSGPRSGSRPAPGSAGTLFVGENRVQPAAETPIYLPSTPQGAPRSRPPEGDPSRALFVSRDGTVRADPP